MMSQEMTSEDWFKKGMALHNNSEEELHCYQQAIHLNPGYAVAYYASALTRNALGDTGGAVADMRTSHLLIHQSELKDHLAKAYFSRGLVALRKGYNNEAEKNFSEVISLQPEYGYAYLNRGVAYRSQGNIDMAISDYGEAIRLNPLDPVPYFNRANCFFDKREYHKAITDYIRTIERNSPELHLVYGGLAAARRLTGDSTGAIAAYSKAIEANPNYADAYINRGAVYANSQKDYTRAIKDFEVALRLKPDSEDARRNLETARKARGILGGLFSRWL
jgi:tetratricopeptide (TPR) repeat protein